MYARAAGRPGISSAALPQPARPAHVHTRGTQSRALGPDPDTFARASGPSRGLPGPSRAPYTPTAPSTPPVRHGSALNVCLLHSCPRGRRVWLNTVDSQTSSSLIRREKQAGLRALRMTDVLAVPGSGGWVCGSQRGPCSLGLPALPHFYSTATPHPHPILVLALLTLTIPQAARCPSFLRATGSAAFPPPQPPGRKEPVPSPQCAPLRGHRHIWAARAKPHKSANSCTAASPIPWALLSVYTLHL